MIKAAIVMLSMLVVVLGVLLWLTTPREWPILQGTLKAKKVVVEGQSYIMLEAEAMNQLGQAQSIDLQLDTQGKKLVVSRYVIRWNPLFKATVNNQWPVFYPLASIEPGKYSITYGTANGEALAGSLDVP